METERKFFELLQVATGRREELSGTPSRDEWTELYGLCIRHTLVGIGYIGIRRLPHGQWPPKALVQVWTVHAERLAARNRLMNKHCRLVYRNIVKAGFRCCILKGQGNLRNYPDVTLADGKATELGMYRTPGDIDVWVRPAHGCRHPVRRVIEYVTGTCPGHAVYYHHSDFPVMRDTEVEVHYRPAFLYSPLRNRRLQRWFGKYGGDDAMLAYEGFNVPSDDFNLVFQLAHMYKHLFEDGIGLRQMLDYFFAVVSERQRANGTAASDGGGDSDDIGYRLGVLGLRRFACAVMYVLHEVFALQEEEMIVPMSVKEGRFLLSEVMAAGNFGHYDDRIARDETPVRRAFRKLRRNCRFLRSYPEEVLCEPFFRVYHCMWRRLRLWRFG